MDVRRTINCKRCMKPFSFEHVRMLPGGGVACFECLGLVQKEEKEKREREDKIWDYQCIRCRFRFQRNNHNIPRTCPECGSLKLIKFDSKEMTGSKLIDIADDPRLEDIERNS